MLRPPIAEIFFTDSKNSSAPSRCQKYMSTVLRGYIYFFSFRRLNAGSCHCWLSCDALGNTVKVKQEGCLKEYETWAYSRAVIQVLINKNILMESWSAHTSCKCILIFGSRSVCYFKTATTFGCIMVKIYIRAFVEPMMRRVLAGGTQKVVNIGKARKFSKAVPQQGLGGITQSARRLLHAVVASSRQDSRANFTCMRSHRRLVGYYNSRSEK